MSGPVSVPGANTRSDDVAWIPPIDINVAHNLTIVAVGRRSGRPTVPRQLLVCEDAPAEGTCAALPMR